MLTSLTCDQLVWSSSSLLSSFPLCLFYFLINIVYSQFYYFVIVADINKTAELVVKMQKPGLDRLSFT